MPLFFYTDANIIIETGYYEGGGVPFQIGTMTVVPLIADAVKIPLLTAVGLVGYVKLL